MSSEKHYMLLKFDPQCGGYAICGNQPQISKSKLINDIIPEEFCVFIQEEDFWLGGKPESFEKAVECFKEEHIVVEVRSDKFFDDKKTFKNLKNIWEEIFPNKQ